MSNVDKELRTARLRLTSVGHGQRALLIADFLRQFVRNATIFVTSVGFTVTSHERRVWVRTTRATTRTIGVFCVGAARIIVVVI